MPENNSVHSLANSYLRLRADQHADILTADETFWPRLMAGELGSFHNEYLVTLLSFTSDWDSWEMHPAGDETVVLLQGAVDFILDQADGPQILEVRQAGDFALVPKGTWHTANVIEAATMLFITPGEGTLGRPRAS